MRINQFPLSCIARMVEQRTTTKLMHTVAQYFFFHIETSTFVNRVPCGYTAHNNSTESIQFWPALSHWLTRLMREGHREPLGHCVGACWHWDSWSLPNTQCQLFDASPDQAWSQWTFCYAVSSWTDILELGMCSRQSWNSNVGLTIRISDVFPYTATWLAAIFTIDKKLANLIWYLETHIHWTSCYNDIHTKQSSYSTTISIHPSIRPSSIHPPTHSSKKDLRILTSVVQAIFFEVLPFSFFPLC